MRTSTHWPRRIIACLAAGAVTTILIAWIPSLVHESECGHGDFDSVTSSLPWIEHRGTVGTRHTWSSVFLEVTLPTGLNNELINRVAPITCRSWRYPDGDEPVCPGGTPDSIARELRGWPFLALWCEYRWDERMLGIREPMMQVHGAFRHKDSIGFRGVSGYNYGRSMPYRPIWTGLVLNILVYAGLSMLISQTTTLVRMRLRRHRGLCDACAYDVAASFQYTAPNAAPRARAT